jgi:glycosyltransferase involved in cell wall biosynthesis
MNLNKYYIMEEINTNIQTTPILSLSKTSNSINDEIIKNIIDYLQYRFEIQYILDTSIYIKLTDTLLFKKFDITLTISNLSLDKLYKLLINSLNKVQNYEIKINNTNLKLLYITEMIEIIEVIDLIEINEVLVAYPISSLSKDLSSTNEKIIENSIDYLHYKIEIQYILDTSITIQIIDTLLFEISKAKIIVTISKMSLDKLHKLLINSLNKVENYEIKINYNNLRLSYIKEFT